MRIPRLARAHTGRRRHASLPAAVAQPAAARRGTGRAAGAPVSCTGRGRGAAAEVVGRRGRPARVRHVRHGRGRCAVCRRRIPHGRRRGRRPAGATAGDGRTGLVSLPGSSEPSKLATEHLLPGSGPESNISSSRGVLVIADARSACQCTLVLDSPRPVDPRRARHNPDAPTLRSRCPRRSPCGGRRRHVPHPECLPLSRSERTSRSHSASWANGTESISSRHAANSEITKSGNSMTRYVAETPRCVTDSTGQRRARYRNAAPPG
jgi:hypothetical protein